MERIPVSSSNIASIGYDHSNQILEVEFNNGRIYHYYSIPRHQYDNLMNAASHGKYLASEIIGTYRDSEQ